MAKQIYSAKTNRPIYYGSIPGQTYNFPGLAPRKSSLYYEKENMGNLFCQNLNKISNSESANHVLATNLEPQIKETENFVKEESKEAVADQSDQVVGEGKKKRKLQNLFKVVFYIFLIILIIVFRLKNYRRKSLTSSRN